MRGVALSISTPGNTLARTVGSTLGKSRAGTLGKSVAGTLRKSRSGTLRKSRSGTLRKSRAGTLGKSLAGTLRKSRAGTLRKSLAGTLGKSLAGTLGGTLGKRVVVHLILAVIAGCAPDYEHTAFRCDADHGCPADQACIAGRCRRGEPSGDGVVCGTATCDLTQQCCIDQSNPARCIAAGDVCPGTSALCDGVEDCRAGERCCDSGSTVACDPSCDQAVCREAADCPSTAPNCCPSEVTPWGECSPSEC